ncbi:uncharacterized protein LOC126570633 [Anopheles aquasalis]|uniref:uncharacterized protein LOC126570633 n=1 Tax=Anopheles aquasalis TaxID=42839 RepID=UPI00215A4FCA|nr:uncharacterized protein LOC126570633 [Anopheles aquasalis]
MAPSSCCTPVVLGLLLLLGATRADPFFGNNYVLPQGARLGAAANTVVRNLDAAQTQVRSFLINPTASPFLAAGATALRDYVGNTTAVLGQLYREIAQVATDRVTAPAVVFTRLNLALNNVRQWDQNLTQSLVVLSQSFNYDANVNTAVFFERFKSDIGKNVQQLANVLELLRGAISPIVGEPLNTQQFLQVISANGTLQELLDTVEAAGRLSTDYASSVTRVVAAVRTANDFQSRAYSLIRTHQGFINTAVDRYSAASNASFVRFLVAADSLVTHLKDTNQSFVFRWPLLFSESVREKLDLLNNSINHLTGNIGLRTINVASEIDSNQRLFKTGPNPLAYVQEEADLLTRILLDVLQGENYCATGFIASFNALPPQVNALITACLADQTSLESQGSAQLVSIANNFLRPYVTTVYGRLNICFQQPFEKMTECLDNIVETIDFRPQFFLLDLTSQLFFERVQEELPYCNSRVLEFVRNAGLRESCDIRQGPPLLN